MNATTSRGAALLAEALFLSPEALPDTATPNTTPGWDSLAHMRLVLAIERELGRRLETLEVLSLTSLTAIEALVDGTGGAPR